MDEVPLVDFLSLSSVDLRQFYPKLVKIGVHRVQHLQDVVDNREDLAGIGMTTVEIRRLKREYAEYQKKAKKKDSKGFLQKVFRHGKKQADQKEKQEKFPVPEKNPRYVAGNTLDGGLGVVPPTRQRVATVCLIRPEDLMLTEDLGRGEFGTVKRGLWKRQEDEMEIPVAVKSLDGHRGQVHQDAFVKEANVMHQIQHDNIIRLYGIVLTEPYRLVTELAPFGCLVDVLRAEPRRVSVYQLCDFSCQIACGMAYLEGKKYIHRDLAARNILLKSMDQVKISDFGLTRSANQDDTYVMSTNSLLPIAWTAPESLEKKEFSVFSDVWSFGVTLWEMFSYGADPYGELSHIQVMKFVRAPTNGRLQKPKDCPSKVWQLIYRCWEVVPLDRPTFPYIERNLKAAMPIKMKAIQNYNGKTAGPDRLSIQKNEIVIVIEDRLPHYLGQNEAFEVGMFPAQCVVHLGDTKREESPPTRNARDDVYPDLTSRISMLSAETGDEKEDNEYLSMHTTEQLITPDDEYLPMQPVFLSPTGSGDSTDERALRMALGEDIVPPPFQPMQRRFETKPQATGYQRSPMDGSLQDQGYHPAMSRAHTQPVAVQRELVGAPDVDMYTEHGGYDQRMTNEPWQRSFTRVPDNYRPPLGQRTSEFGYRREDQTLQEGSGQVERLAKMLPDVNQMQIRAMLVECKWDVQEAFQRIRINQMLELGLDGSTPEKCQRALEHCQWKVDRAAAWLMDSPN